MSNKLSYSALQKFKYCAEAWRLNYVERLRPIKTSSALLFGSAIGKAFEKLLLNRHLEQSELLFQDLWHKQEINGELQELKNNPNISYFKSDMDHELGSNEWGALFQKGLLMLRSFNNNLLPLIEKVYSTEEKVELRSDDDICIGYADAVVQLKGYEDPVILDFKTASRKYEEDAVIKSEQLSHYLYTLGDKYKTRTCGYVVFLKSINKNRKKICKSCGFDGSATRHKTCNNEIIQEIDDVSERVTRCGGEWEESIHPTCTMQLLVNEIPETFVDTVIDEIGLINDKINNNEIVQNWDACNNDFGKKCSYYHVCHSGDYSDLIKLPKKEEVLLTESKN